MSRLMTLCVLVVVVVVVSVVCVPVFRFALTGIVVVCRSLGGV